MKKGSYLIILRFTGNSPKRGTLTLLWTEYCLEASAAGKKPYMSTQFNDNYRKWAHITKATMRIQHKPGDEMEVDWAGATINIYDEVTGEVSPAYLFVAVLPCSLYVYAEICSNMKSDTFINCHVHAYTYFGGSARLLIPDNLKTGVTRNTRYDTLIPRAYKEMADHYNTAIVPARVKHPDDKPNAEGSVKYATTWILAALRNYHFFSIEEAKTAVSEKLEELNLRPFKKRLGNRRSAFEREHMPLNHQKYLSYNPEEFTYWAEGIGAYTLKTVNYFLYSEKEPEQGYKYCVGLMKAAEKYGDRRIEKACEKLLTVTAQPSLRSIITILKNGQDKLTSDSESSNQICRKKQWYYPWHLGI